MWATGPITVHTELAPGDASGAPLQVKCPRTSNCSVVVASTKLRSLTGALQKAQCEALAAEEEKEPNISVMHLSAGAKGASGSKEAAVFITGTVLPTYRWTGPDQLHIKTCKEAKTKPGSHCATQWSPWCRHKRAPRAYFSDAAFDALRLMFEVKRWKDGVFLDKL
ncbi:neurensin 1-like isoform X2 [Embiotoca jacksoni]|uniref:neurensin 1-like isoform X2 n=1 Tax=Embiotoca jacksoni TaxID=100190 RepID=UPI003703BC57